MAFICLVWWVTGGPLAPSLHPSLHQQAWLTGHVTAVPPSLPGGLREPGADRRSSWVCTRSAA